MKDPVRIGIAQEFRSRKVAGFVAALVHYSKAPPQDIHALASGVIHNLIVIQIGRALSWAADQQMPGIILTPPTFLDKPLNERHELGAIIERFRLAHQGTTDALGRQPLFLEIDALSDAEGVRQGEFLVSV